nr:sulfatase-like hydrolase/transferase [Devosia sp.]
MVESRPNVLLVMSDQQRADTLPSYGNAFVEAPYLEQLAQSGARFTNCRTVFPVCTPARASLWTGLYPHQHGIFRNVYGVPDQLSDRGLTDRSIFQLLAKEGYECSYFGKWHLGTANPGPFSVFQAFNSGGGHWVDGLQSFQGGTYIPDRDTDNLIAWIRARDVTRPFFSVISYYPPHDPFSAPLDTTDKYRRMAVPFPGYYGSITAIDRCVGRILAGLHEANLADNTLIAFFSDHGETFHSRDGVTSKFVCTDDALRVPLILHFPSTIGHGLAVSELVGLQDIMPTILDFVGVTIPTGLAGRSLRGLCHKIVPPETDWRTSFYVENETFYSLPESTGPVVPRTIERAVCNRRHKLVVSQDESRPMELFDMFMDPEERRNLVDELETNSSVLATCEEMLREILRHATDLNDAVGQQMAESRLGQLREVKASFGRA